MQWIPKGHTLEPKIWGEIGLRHGLYIGLGLLGGIALFFALSPFGLWLRLGGLMVPPVLGLVFGFLRIKGLVPERYLHHRLRFRLRRATTLGVWDTGTALGSPGGLLLGDLSAVAPRTSARRSASATPVVPTATPTRPRPSAVTSVACLVEANPFGILFTAAAWLVAAAALVYALSGVWP